MRVAVCMTRWNHKDKAKGASGHIWHRGVRASVLMLALLGILIAPVQAQLRIEITEGVVAPTPIAIANFTGPDGKETDEGRLIASIIANDLISSGLFEPIDEAAFIAPPGSPSIKPNFANWEPLGAKGLLVGSAARDEMASCRSNSFCGMW